MSADAVHEDLLEEEDDLALPRKKRDDEEMDITPMIDITFLLLIFFVVASKMDPTKIGTIPSADNGLAVSADDSAIIFVDPGAGDEVILKRRDGSEFSRDEATQSSEIIEYVTSELEKSIGKNKNQVMLLGDANVKVGKVTRIQQIIGDAFEDIESTYIAVKEE
ncbi:biopolymer transport exbD2 protein [Rhodopirellula maiorica SM1]|uniref:Biopolymer transport exbD2 protein n=1 Tax=Rhodopirellula maiorica SM1 TaxID=1265738 RepID=M5RSS2_9BACT|nr:biopolymer transporter ExbD [Rhodopirellula maiorica]EMI18437.1 biopolymer transport exbD2 protein [Rhodopirellula maiorica SM1]